MMQIHINNIIEVEMNKLILIAALLLCSLNAYHIYDAVVRSGDQVINWPFTQCGSSVNWNIQSLTFASQPARNTNDDIVVTGTATGDVSFNSLDLNVKLNGVQLHSESVDFVQSFSEGDIVQFKYQNYIPSFAPPGTYGLTFSFKTKSGKVIGCMEFSFKL